MPKKKPTKKLTRLPKALRKVRQQKVLELYSAGKTKPVIAKTLGMRRQDVTRDLTSAMADMVKHYANTSPEHTFVRYASFNTQVISQLRNLFETFLNDPDTKQYGAAVSALKAQSDIYDKILDKGVEFGVINKAKAKETIRSTPQDLRVELRREITTLTRLLDEIDDHTNIKALTTTNAIQGKTVYTRKIKRVQKNPLGTVRAIPDWKYKQDEPHNQPEPKTDASELIPNAYPSVTNKTPQQNELTRLQSELDKEKGITPEVLPKQDKTQQVEETITTTEQWLITPIRSKTKR